MSRRPKIVILFLCIALLAVSCTAHKKTANPTLPQSFEWLTANFDIEAEGNGSVFNDLKGQLRMRRDSLIWVSLTATMGVEVGRMKLSNDSVYILNRLEKRYLAEPLDTIVAQLGIPVSLSLVQALHLDNNEGIPPVENQTVLLKTFVMGGFSAKVRYNNIRLDEKTVFPLKITDKMERIEWVRQQ
jgi:hypothetical protein